MYNKGFINLSSCIFTISLQKILILEGNLNGFGWAFNADFNSSRYEHPTTGVLNKFFKNVPNFLLDPTQTGKLSTLHIYLDSTPQLNFC